MSSHHLPERLWVTRHGQSLGNVARAQAEHEGLAEVDLAFADASFPLTGLGRAQAQALGETLAELPANQRPSVILCSPFLRARDTALIAAEYAGIDRQRVRLISDERLRPKAFGVLEKLTTHGVARRFPHLVEERARIGRFHFCPPGGESHCDVVLRVRDALSMICRDFRNARVLVVAHQVVVNAVAYLLEAKNSSELGTSANVPNACLVSYERQREQGRMALRRVAPLAA